MSLHSESLYELLPRVYRIRDSEGGDALRQFLSVIAEQVAVLEENLEQLYDDQFIETCAEWVIPYIGDLIGYNPLHSDATKYLSPRSEVANTIAYRRRKGTATMLEQMARDVTGRPARVVEFFRLLATTQYMNHVRTSNLSISDLRDGEAFQRLNTAFETTARTVDVRRIDPDQGRYNIPNIGIFLWRLQAYPLSRSPAVALDDRRLFFSPLGHNQPLFTNPAVETDIAHLAEPINVPDPISRGVMDRHLDHYYPTSTALNVNGTDISREDIIVCNLQDAPNGDWAHAPADEDTYAIDPELGRIVLPPNLGPNPHVLVDYHYGFSADIGGGPYERADGFDYELNPVESVSSPNTLQSALNNVAGEGVVEIIDNTRYEETLSVEVKSESRIEVRAANEHRPIIVLDDDMDIQGGDKSIVTLDGLLISGGRLVIPSGNNRLRRLRLRHCTLVPGHSLTEDGLPARPGIENLVVESPHVVVEIEHCIIGALRVTEGAEVFIRNSIIDANHPEAIAYSGLTADLPGGTLELVNCTVIGKVYTREMTLASNCIFHSRLRDGDNWSAPVQSVRKQAGCIRFSYLPPGSRTPRRYRCQPELAVTQSLRDEEAQHGPLTPAQKSAIAALVLGRVRPAFRDTRYGQPAYGQLALSCPDEIAAGADDESEMGVFHDLFHPQREANLRVRLEEYLRFGLQAGIFYSN